MKASVAESGDRLTTFYDFISNGITDRDAPALYSKAFNRSYIDLWRDKVECTDTSAELIGQEDFLIHQLRGEFISRFNNRNPDTPLEPETLKTYMVKHPVMDFMRAVPDGLYPRKKLLVRFAIQDQMNHAQVSLKSLKPRHRVPEKEWIEIQHMLAILEYPRAFFVSSITGKEFAYTEVARDEIFISNHVAECILFWDYVRRGVMPEYQSEHAGRELNAS